MPEQAISNEDSSILTPGFELTEQSEHRSGFMRSILTGRGRVIAGIGGSIVAALGAGYLFLRGSSPDEQLPEQVAIENTASATPSPSISSIASPTPSAETYPFHTVPGDNPYESVFVRTPIPAELSYLYDMSQGDFENLGTTDKDTQLLFWSWLSQRQEDFNAAYAYISGDRYARELVAEPYIGMIQDSTATTLINTVDAYERMAITFGSEDYTDPNESNKAIAALRVDYSSNVYIGFLRDINDQKVSSHNMVYLAGNNIIANSEVLQDFEKGAVYTTTVAGREVNAVEVTWTYEDNAGKMVFYEFPYTDYEGNSRVVLLHDAYSWSQ